MVDRDLTIKFIGKDAGLSQTALAGGKAIDKLGDQALGASRQLEKAGGSAQGFNSAIAGLAAGASFAALNLLTSALQSAGDAVLGFVANTFEVGGAAQQADVAFTTILGSAEKAQDLLGELSDFAATTPFDLPGVTAAGQQLLAFGFLPETITENLTRLGDVAAGVNTDFGELSTIYGKARVQGRLFAEDVNQLTERGIPIIQQFAKQFGVAESQVKVLVEQGKIGFPALEQAFIDMTSAGGQFGGLMEAQSKTIPGQVSNIQDSFTRLQIAVFKALGPTTTAVLTTFQSTLDATGQNFDGFGPIVEAGERLNEVLSENPEIAERLGEAFGEFANTAVDQLAGLIDAAAQFADEQENIERIAEGIESIAAALRAAGTTIGFVADLSLKVAALQDSAKDLPVIGGLIQKLFLGPLAGIQNLVGAINALGELRDRADRLKDNLLGTRREFEALNGAKLGEGLKAGSAALDTALGSLKENAKASTGAIAETSTKAQDATEAFKALDAAAKSALGAASQAEAERLTSLRRTQQGELQALRQQLEAGAITVEQFTQRRTALEQKFNDDARKATIERIRSEITAEQERTRKLEAIGGPESQVKIQESKLKTAELTDQLLSEQISAEEDAADRIVEAREEAQKKAEEAAKERQRLEEDATKAAEEQAKAAAEARAEAEREATEAAVEAIAERQLAQENAIAAEVLALGRVLQAVEQVNASYERQGQLLGAQTNLVSTLGSALSDSFDNGIKLLDQDIANADNEKERTRLTKQRDNLEKQSAAARRASLERSQALELLSFDLRQRQLEIELQIEQARIRGAIAENQSAQSRASANVETLKAEGASDGQINAAQLNVQATQQEGEALGQQYAASIERGFLQQQIGGLDRQAIVSAQRSALDSFDTEELDRRFEELDEREQNARSGRERRQIGRERDQLEGQNNQLQRRNNQGIQFIGRNEAQSFDQAIAGLNSFADRIEGTGLVGRAPNAALNPLASLPSLGSAQRSITPALPLPAQAGAAANAMQPIQIAGGLQVTNDIAITVTGEQVGDGTLTDGVEAAVMAGLSKVVARTSAMLR